MCCVWERTCLLTGCFKFLRVFDLFDPNPIKKNDVMWASYIVVNGHVKAKNTVVQAKFLMLQQKLFDWAQEQKQMNGLIWWLTQTYTVLSSLLKWLKQWKKNILYIKIFFIIAPGPLFIYTYTRPKDWTSYQLSFLQYLSLMSHCSLFKFLWNPQDPQVTLFWSVVKSAYSFHCLKKTHKFFK